VLSVSVVLPVLLCRLLQFKLPAAVVLMALLCHMVLLVPPCDLVPTGIVVYLVLLSTWCCSATGAVILFDVRFLPGAVVLPGSATLATSCCCTGVLRGAVVPQCYIIMHSAVVLPRCYST
jgi:hypothetical protein